MHFKIPILCCVIAPVLNVRSGKVARVLCSVVCVVSSFHSRQIFNSSLIFVYLCFEFNVILECLVYIKYFFVQECGGEM